MSIEVLSSGASSTSDESFSFSVDYDTVAETIGLTCTGTGHANLALVETASQTSLGSMNCDQFGATTGQVVDGASNGPVTYTGARVVVVGPGATGVDSTGVTVPAILVPATAIGQFNVPRGQIPTLSVTVDWHPNSFSALKGAALAKKRELSLSRHVKRCLKRGL